MADVFDEIETAPATDVFDEIETPVAPPTVAPSISGGILGSTPPPPPEQFDPNNPEHARAALQSQAALETFNTMMLPFRADWFDASTDEERARAAGQAEVDKLETRRALDSFTPEQRNPSHPDYESAVGAARAYTAAKDRSDALNARIASVQPGAVAEREAAEKAQATEQQRREFMGETNPFIALLSQAASYPLNVVGGALQDVSPTLGSELMRGGQQFKETASRAPGATGAIARGVGDVGGLMLGGPSGAIKASISATVRGAQDAYAQTLLATGSEEQADQARLKAARDMLAYMAVGTGASRAVQAALPAGTAPFRAAVLSGTGAAGANVATSFGMAAARGEEYGLQQLTADIVMGGVEGVQTGKRVKAEQAAAPPRPSIEQPPVKSLTELAPELGSEGPRVIGTAVQLPDGGVERGTTWNQSHAEILKGAIEKSPEISTDFPDRLGFAVEMPDGSVVWKDRKEAMQIAKDQGLVPADAGTELKSELLAGKEQPVERQRRLGPGAANIEEPFNNNPVVGAWNAKVDEQRAARGLEPLASEARKADEVTWDQAAQRFDENPNYGRDLVDTINDGKKESVSDTEQAAILREMLSLREQRDLATQRAFDEATYSPEERAAFLEEAKTADERLERTEEADRKSGTAQGRALRIRRLMAYEDFTLAGLMGKARRAKGEDLTPAEAATLKTKADRFQKAKETFEAKVDEAEVGQPIDDAIRAIEAEAAKDPEFTPEVRSLADRIVARLERASKGASERIRGLMSQLGGQLSVGADVVTGAKLVKELALKAAADIGRLGLKSTLKFTRWATNMVKEFGEGIKPYLKDAWDQADKDIDAAVAGTRTKKPKEVKAAVTKENVGAAVEQLGAGMKSKGGKLSEMRSDIQKLVETLVRGGIKQREPLVDAVHEVLKGVDPSVTRRQTADLISGYGDFKRLNPDSVKAEVRDLKQQLQLAAKIEDVLGSVPLKRSGIERQPLSDEGRALTKKLNELSRELGIKITDPATQLKSILGALETRLTNRIKDLKVEIAKGQRTVKTKTPTPTNAKIEGLRAELEQVQAQHEAVFGKETRKMTDEQKIRIYKTRTQNRIKELETRIQKGDFGPRPKRKELDLTKDSEAVKAKAEMERVKKEFQQKQFEWQQAQRTRTQKFIDGVKEGLGASRSIITSADVSAPFRQGGFLLMGDLVFHPIRAAKQIATMFRQLVSERGFEEAQAQISLRPNARSGLYDQAGLYLSDLSTKLSAREENMRSNLAERIPIIGRIVRASNRAYTGFLNRQRADAFDAMVESMGGPSKLTPDEVKAIANFVNTATGRGTVAQLERAADVAARYFFSPRFLASRFQLALGQPLLSRTGSLRVKRETAKQYGKFAVGLAAIYGLAKLAGSDLERDPRSADFGKAKFGNTRIDPLAGLAQVTTFLAREITGETKKKGRIEEKNRLDTFGRFVRTKLAPIPGVAADRMAEQRLDMSKPTPYRKNFLRAVGEDAARLGVPLSYQEAPEVYKEHGFLRGTILEVLNLLGMGVQSYDKR